MNKTSKIYGEIAQRLTDRGLPLKLMSYVSEVGEDSDAEAIVKELEKDFKGSGDNVSEKIAKRKNDPTAKNGVGGRKI